LPGTNQDSGVDQNVPSGAAVEEVPRLKLKNTRPKPNPPLETGARTVILTRRKGGKER